MAERHSLTLLTIAAQNHGVCARQELLDAGVSRSSIDRRIRIGFLSIAHPGVYMIPQLRNELTRHSAALKAVPNSVASRRTAASLNNFQLREIDHLIHITAPNGRSQRLDGVRVHETRRITVDDIVERSDGLRFTSPARTVVDLAGELSRNRLRHLVQTEIAAKHLVPSELQACISSLARRGLPGIGRLRPLMIHLFDADPLAGSELERKVQYQLADRGLTGFIAQFRPPWFDGIRGVVDFADADSMVIVEADGRRWHATEQAMADDRRRDRLATTHGWVVLRVSWSEVVHRPAATFAEIQDVVQARRRALNAA
ncbi:MAG: DUF559 domain-containing protein [Actinomycetota bacterium]|nr:DUF559 domain-containing protein [Actinomycetota bacterium]